MAIAITLRQYLENNEIPYETLNHHYTLSSIKTAQASHVSGDRIAKGVVLTDGKKYLLAVLPASHHIRFDDIRELISDKLEMATEEEVESLFTDCQLGAIPPIGRAYGLEVLMDESLAGDEDIFFEGGDHATLIHVKAREFGKMMENARRGSFSRHD
jgi:Ala-tRNA(Pro) deacylase